MPRPPPRDPIPAVIAILLDEVKGVGPSDFGLSQERFKSIVAAGRKKLH
jgi:hypothetical protein